MENINCETIPLNIQGLNLIRFQSILPSDEDAVSTCPNEAKHVFEYEYIKNFSMKGIYKNRESARLRVRKGMVYFTIWDFRKDSETYGKKCGILLSDRNKWILLFPANVHYGFICGDDYNLLQVACEIEPAIDQDQDYDTFYNASYWPIQEVKRWKKMNGKNQPVPDL